MCWKTERVVKNEDFQAISTHTHAYIHTVHSASAVSQRNIKNWKIGNDERFVNERYI